MNSQHALPSGTILHGKYHLLRCFAHGGFSLLYLAERLSDGRLVAVKELFVDSYMDRLPQEAAVQMRDSSFLRAFTRDRDRFRHEWEMMTRLQEAPGIAKPLDFFEENGTFYIVMEHLPGGTLRENVRARKENVRTPHAQVGTQGHERTGSGRSRTPRAQRDTAEDAEDVRDRGVLSADSLFRSMHEVLQLLARMHEEGFVHGDISPDNLVMDGGGMFRLIDFGAVTKIGAEAGDEEHLRKAGYTAPEVFAPGYRAQPASDVYSLCAVFYFALTGDDPEDSLERTMLDEVKPLAEAVPGIEPLVADMADRGLSMDTDKRWQSMTPILDAEREMARSKAEKEEEEAQHRKRRKRNRIILAGAGTAIAVMALVLFCLTHRELLLFRGQETQTIAFYYGETLDEAGQELLRSNIEQKVQHITGDGKYLLSDQNGVMQVTMLYEPFDGVNIPELLNKYFNFSRFVIKAYDEWGDWLGSSELIFDDLVQVTESEKGIVITVDQDPMTPIWEIGGMPDYKLGLVTGGSKDTVWDSSHTLYGGEVYDFDLETDYSEYDLARLTFTISNDQFGSAYEKELFMDCASQEAVPIQAFQYSRHVQWEAYDEDTRGSDQRQPDQLRGEVVLCEYRDDNISVSEVTPRMEGKIEGVGYPDSNFLFASGSGEGAYDWTDESVLCLKRRLDTLQVPYACGWDGYDNQMLYVAVAAENVPEIEAALLFAQKGETLLEGELMEVRSPSGILLSAVDEAEPVGAADGQIRVKLKDEDHLEDAVNRIRDHGEELVQLCIDERPVYQAALDDMEEGGWMAFSQTLLTNAEEADSLAGTLAGLLNEIQGNDVNYDLEPYRLSGMLYTDSLKQYHWEKTLWDAPACERKDEKEKIERNCAQRGMTCDVDYFHAYTIRCAYDEEAALQYEHPYAMAADFLKDYQSNNEVRQIEFVIRDVRDLPDVFYYKMTVTWDKQDGTLQATWSMDHSGDGDWDYYADEEKAEQYLSSEKIFAEAELTHY